MRAVVKAAILASGLTLAPAAAHAATTRLLDRQLSWGGTAPARLDDGGGSGLYDGPNKPMVALLMAIVPGLGHWIVLDRPSRGLSFFAGVAVLEVMAGLAYGNVWPLFWGFQAAAFVVWLANLYDAYMGAVAIFGAGGDSPEPRAAMAPAEPASARAPAAPLVQLLSF